MHNKRRTSHTANLNFRPTNNDINIDQKGTKPTSEPTSIGEIFTLMVLYVCKKSLFFNTNIKIAIYLGSLFLVSLIADVIPIPKMYLSRSDNIFNKYLVKFAWGWNLILLIPFVLFTSLIYCCGQVQMIVKHHLLRIGIATFFWWFWTTLFNYVEASYGKCGNLNYFTKGKCLQAGHLWNGFDLSGHSFILIYGSLLIIEETRSIQNWDGIREHLRLEEHYRMSKETEFNSNPLRFLTDNELKKIKFYYTKYTPYIRGLVIVICIFQIIWDIMLICTMLYYHVMIEKFLGGVSAILTWFVTYRLWYTHPKLLPKLPGEGIFRYIKNNSKQSSTASRKQPVNVMMDNFPPENGIQEMEVEENSTVRNDGETVPGIMDVDETQKCLEHEDNALDVNHNVNNIPGVIMDVDETQKRLEHEDNVLDVNQNINNSIISAHTLTDPNGSTHKQLDSIDNESIEQTEQSGPILTDRNCYSDTDGEVKKSLKKGYRNQK